MPFYFIPVSVGLRLARTLLKRLLSKNKIFNILKKPIFFIYFVCLFKKYINRSDLYEVDYSCSCLRISQKSSDGDDRRRKSPLDGAAYLWPKKITVHSTVMFVSAFIIVSTGKPENTYKWVLIGPKPIAVVFKSLFFQLFIPGWSTKYQCLVNNLLYQPYLYLYFYHPN